jgi:hypothetical protein
MSVAVGKSYEFTRRSHGLFDPFSESPTESDRSVADFDDQVHVLTQREGAWTRSGLG